MSLHAAEQCELCERTVENITLHHLIPLLRADRNSGLKVLTLEDVVLERPVALLLLKNAPRFKAVKAFVSTLCNGNAASSSFASSSLKSGQTDTSEATAPTPSAKETV